MASNLTKTMIGWRIKVMTYAMCSYFEWDTEKAELLISKNYFSFNASFLLMSQISYLVILTTHLISKLYSEQGIGSGTEIGSYVIGWVEALSIILFIAIQFRVLGYRRHLASFSNQMFQYSNEIQNLLNERGLQLDNYLLKVIRTGEIVMLFAAFATGIIPFVYAICLGVEFEPTHKLIEEVLEVNLQMSLANSHYILVITWATLNATNSLFIVVTVGIIYFQLSKICISVLTPVTVQQRVNTPNSFSRRIEYQVMTRSLGVRDDTFVMKMYRIQQMFNRLLNEFYASILISCHHVVVLAVFVFMSFVLIKYSAAIMSSGISATVLFLMGISCPIIAEWYESLVSGNICETSAEFVKKTRRLTNRKSYFHKFVLSCPNMAYQTGEPFFGVDKRTFPQFIQQGLEFLISLLVM
ncbi:unnamed protein product [Orchesella dallaii]|uniref:Odorant receptor n=1 Tax=Orchesella dallaii TaxID=48710 RepID=A0ABP1PNP4_9HEXA